MAISLNTSISQKTSVKSQNQFGGVLAIDLAFDEAGDVVCRVAASHSAPLAIATTSNTSPVAASFARLPVYASKRRTMTSQ